MEELHDVQLTEIKPLLTGQVNNHVIHHTVTPRSSKVHNVAPHKVNSVLLVITAVIKDVLNLSLYLCLYRVEPTCRTLTVRSVVCVCVCVCECETGCTGKKSSLSGGQPEDDWLFYSWHSANPCSL